MISSLSMTSFINIYTAAYHFRTHVPLTNPKSRASEMNEVLVLLKVLILRHYWAASLKASVIDSVCCDRCIRTSVRLCVCVSVTLAHRDKAARRYEMPFGRDTCVVHSQVTLC